MGKYTSNDILDAMWDDFDRRVWLICEYLGIQKQQLAEKIGRPQQCMSRLKTGRHHAEAYLILYYYPDINARWLLFGEGEMLDERRPSPTAEVPQHPDLLSTTAFTPQPAAPTASTAELGRIIDRLSDRCTALAIENGMLKSQLGEKVSRGLASA